MTQLPAPTEDHPQRQSLADELHARPFPALDVPCNAVYVALKQPGHAANRDRAADLSQLAAFLAPHGVALPDSGLGHFTARAGDHDLKWESHTEFVTYLASTAADRTGPFDASQTRVFAPDWLAASDARRIAAVQIHVAMMPDTPGDIAALLQDWFVPESLACSAVLDGAAIIAGDFQIDAAGQMRFAVFARKGTGARRVGRIVQRLCEIETYRAMSMLGLRRARDLTTRLNALEPQLSALVTAMSDDTRKPEATLDELLAISAELESLAVQSSFRFGATGAYEAIVTQRIEVLREARYEGRQTFAEFMMRRYDPAMRTVKSAERRLQEMAQRAERAGELLRTRVDVERSSQNQLLLASMDRRADLQLRLQQTVEGLSVVAISYYAVNLATYLAYPVTEHFGLSKGLVTAALVPIVVGLVWLMVRRIRKGMH